MGHIVEGIIGDIITAVEIQEDKLTQSKTNILHKPISKVDKLRQSQPPQSPQLPHNKINRALRQFLTVLKIQPRIGRRTLTNQSIKLGIGYLFDRVL